MSVRLRGSYVLGTAVAGAALVASTLAPTAGATRSAAARTATSTIIGQPAACADLPEPSGIAVSSHGTVYFAIEDDTSVHDQILKVDPATHRIALVAGAGPYGFAGDGGPAKSALLAEPSGIWQDATGLFIADHNNNRVRFVNGSTGIITTVAGNGKSGSSAKAAHATATPVQVPTAVRTNGTGGLEIGNPTGGAYVNLAAGSLTPTSTHWYSFTVDPSNNTYSSKPVTSPYALPPVVRYASHSSTPVGFARVTKPFTNADGVNATHADLLGPIELASDAAGNIYVLDGREVGLSGPTPTGQIREIDHATHLIHTLAGFLAGSTPDRYSRLAVTPNGDVYVTANAGSEILKRDHATGTVSLVAGGGSVAGGASDPNYCP